jgi:TonB family protein
VFTVTQGRKWILITAVAAGFVTAAYGAQQTNFEEGKRRTKAKTPVAYPELARRMRITGKVKIEVMIAPDGHVKSARAVGGHPVLVQSCLDSVKDWKFEATPEESTQIVEFNFTE